MASDRLYIEKGCCSKRLQNANRGLSSFSLLHVLSFVFSIREAFVFLSSFFPCLLALLELVFPSFLGLPIAWFTVFSFASFAFSFTNLFASLDMSLSVLLRLFPPFRPFPFLSFPVLSLLSCAFPFSIWTNARDAGVQGPLATKNRKHEHDHPSCMESRPFGSPSSFALDSGALPCNVAPTVPFLSSCPSSLLILSAFCLGPVRSFPFLV